MTILQKLIVLIITALATSDPDIQRINDHTSAMASCTHALVDLAPLVTGLKARPFGSMISGLRTPHSDLDIQVRSGINKICKNLRKPFEFKALVKNKSLHVLTIEHIPSGLLIDIKEANEENDVSMDIRANIKSIEMENFIRKVKCWHASEFMPKYSFADNFSGEKIKKPIINAFAMTLLAIMFYEQEASDSLAAFGNFLIEILSNGGVYINASLNQYNHKISFEKTSSESYHFYRWGDSHNMFKILASRKEQLSLMIFNLDTIEEDFQSIYFPTPKRVKSLSKFSRFLLHSTFHFRSHSIPCALTLWEDNQRFELDTFNGHQLFGLEIEILKMLVPHCKIRIENRDENEWKIVVWLDSMECGLFLPKGTMDLELSYGQVSVAGTFYRGWEKCEETITAKNVKKVCIDTKYCHNGSITYMDHTA